MCKIRFWQFRDCGGHILPLKNANFGRFEVAFDRPEFDRTQQCLDSLSNAFDRQQALLCSIELGSIKCNLETAKIVILPWENMSTTMAKLPKSEFAHL